MPQRGFAVRSFKVWFRPAVFLSLWICATSYTVSELVTVAPSLHTIPTQPQRVRATRTVSVVGPRTHLVAR
jgi:hypothetical protein